MRFAILLIVVWLSAVVPAVAGSPQSPESDGPGSFSVPDRGGQSTTSSGTAETLRVGYGRIRADAGSTTPCGIAIFQFRDSDDPFLEDDVFQGLTDDGELVATLRFDVQRLFENELNVVATLSTTPELGEDDDVNTINIRVGGQRIQLRERTAEKVFPSDEVSAVFGNDDARGLIEGPIESVDLDLRNVDRWERIAAVIP